MGLEKDWWRFRGETRAGRERSKPSILTESSSPFPPFFLASRAHHFTPIAGRRE